MSASPNNNTLMLVALGLGAFYFLTRHPAAGANYTVPRGAGAAQTNSGAITGQLIGQGGNLIGKLLSKLNLSASTPASASIYGGALDSGNLFSLTPDFSAVNVPVGIDLGAGIVSPASWSPDAATGLFF